MWRARCSHGGTERVRGATRGRRPATGVRGAAAAAICKSDDTARMRICIRVCGRMHIRIRRARRRRRGRRHGEAGEARALCVRFAGRCGGARARATRGVQEVAAGGDARAPAAPSAADTPQAPVRGEAALRRPRLRDRDLHARADSAAPGVAATGFCGDHDHAAAGALHVSVRAIVACALARMGTPCDICVSPCTAGTSQS